MAIVVKADQKLLDRLKDASEHDAVFDELTAKSNAIDPSDSIVGAFLAFYMGDGYAYYLCTSESPLEVQHIPLWDEWEINVKGFDKQYLTQKIVNERRINALKSKQTLTL